MNGNLHKAFPLTSHPALTVLSVRLRVKCRDARCPPDMTEPQSFYGMIKDATNDKYGDRVGENFEGRGRTIHHPGATLLGTLSFPPKNVRIEDNGDTPLLVSHLPFNRTHEYNNGR